MDATKVRFPIFKVPVQIYEFLDCGKHGTMQGARKHYYLVEAATESAAKEELESSWSFWKNYNSLSTDRRKNLKPFRLDEERKIERVLYCDIRHKNINGEYTCGRPAHSIEGIAERNDETTNMNGEFGICCIEGFDIPENCPYSKEGRSVA